MFKKFFEWLSPLKEKKMKAKANEATMKFGSGGVSTGQFARGDILLGFGLHEVKIVTNGRPCTVSLSIEDPTGGIAVCHGNVNKIGVNVLDDGFVLYADIQSNTAFIKWNCEF